MFGSQSFARGTFDKQHHTHRIDSLILPSLCATAEFARTYGSIVLEVTPSGVPIVLLFDRADIDKVLRYPSRYPFRPPTDIVAIYRKRRSDRYASVGITNE